MKKPTLYLLVFVFGLILLIPEGLQAQLKSKAEMRNLIDNNLHLAANQYKLLAQNTPKNVMPRSYDAKKNEVITSNTRWWCSGFFPGTLLYIYEYTKDPVLLEEAKNRLLILDKEKHYTGSHDLGFMMYCSFGNAYRLLGKPEYKTTLDTSATTLITRYRPTIASIQSWDSGKNYKCPVIIDNMMNLELLCWVSDNGSDPKYKNIAISHANTTLKNHFRKDYSSYHVVDYDLSTGQIIKKVTRQGAADSSAWARGQAWGLYGYTMMYRFTKDAAYLSQARHIAQFILNHPNLPADKIPYWDFNAPDIPYTNRDVSAGAIMASALLELGQYVNKKERKQYIDVAQTILQSLSSDTYRAKAGTNGGFILLHSVGAKPVNSEVDVPLTYADYYFVEALLRFKKWYL